MCCSLRATVYFLASNHIYFSVTQMVRDIPAVVHVFSEKLLVVSLTLIFGILFTISGFITFRGADEQSPRLVRLSGLYLASVLSLRFVLLGFSLMINETLPEAMFLYVYRTASIPIMFTLLIYVFYGAMLFCYYNELAEEDANMTTTTAARRARRRAGEPYSYQVTPFGGRSPLQFQPQTHTQQGHGHGSRQQNLHLPTLLK